MEVDCEIMGLLFFADSVLPPCKVRVKQKVECHDAI